MFWGGSQVYDDLKVVISTAHKHYFSASHHEQKNKKRSSQIRFLAVTIKQQRTFSMWINGYLSVQVLQMYSFICSISCFIVSIVFIVSFIVFPGKLWEKNQVATQSKMLGKQKQTMLREQKSNLAIKIFIRVLSLKTKYFWNL